MYLINFFFAFCRESSVDGCNRTSLPADVTPRTRVYTEVVNGRLRYGLSEGVLPRSSSLTLNFEGSSG